MRTVVQLYINYDPKKKKRERKKLLEKYKDVIMNHNIIIL